MQPWLALTAPHGLTDLFLSPGLAIRTQMFSAVTVAALPDEHARLGVLLPLSVVHMRKDCGGLFNSAVIHAMWLVSPPVAIAFLGYYHTPMHYIKILRHGSRRSQLALACCMVASALCMWSPRIDDVYIYDAMWVAPVIGHIYFTEIFDST